VDWKQGKKTFLYEQYGNVIENKGPLWKSGPKAGMSLIAKEISAKIGNPIENKGDNRYEKS